MRRSLYLFLCLLVSQLFVLVFVRESSLYLFLCLFVSQDVPSLSLRVCIHVFVYIYIYMCVCVHVYTVWPLHWLVCILSLNSFFFVVSWQPTGLQPGSRQVVLNRPPKGNLPLPPGEGARLRCEEMYPLLLSLFEQTPPPR